MFSRFVYRTPLTAPYPAAVLLPGLLPLPTFRAIVVVSGHCHSRATSGDRRVRGLIPGKLLKEHVDGREFDILEIEGAVAVFLLPKKMVLLRKAPEDDVFDEVIRNLLPHVLEAYPQVVHLRDEISRIPAVFHRCEQEVFATRATSLFGVAVVPG